MLAEFSRARRARSGASKKFWLDVIVRTSASPLFRLNFNVYINVGNKERAGARNRKRMVAGSELKSYA